MAYYYYQSIRKTIIQFLDVFNDVRIARYNSSGVVTGYRKVPLKFGPKEKVWHWIHQKKHEEMLPIMSVIMSSIDYAAERQTNKLRSIVKSKTISDGEMSTFLNPVPYNMMFTLSIWSLHMVDVDQIMEQILPYFMPNIFIRINIPELDATLDLKVLFQACAPDVSMELADEDIRVIKWNLDFLVQGYLFQPLKTAGIIEKIMQKIYMDDSGWADRFTETVFTSGGVNDKETVALYTKAVSPYYDEDVWVASTYYDIGDIVKPVTTNGYLYEVHYVIGSGKSGTTEPDWSSTKNTPVTDNHVVWMRYEHDSYKKLVEYENFE
jgi:hypothetical protein